MNSATIIAGLFMLAIGYAVGFQHGEDRASFAADSAAPPAVSIEYPYASVCSEMLEAAWSLEKAPLPALPHKP